MANGDVPIVVAGSGSHRCPQQITTVSPHVLRHTGALATLQATGDIRKVALWLGHARQQTTEVYLQVDPTEKLDMPKAVVPPGLRPGKFRPPDKLMAMLSGALASRPS